MGWLARDAELLQAVVGGIGRVTAVGPRDEVASYASLQVQMTGSGGASLRWSVAPSAGGPSGAVLMLIGEQGTLSVRMPDETDNRWQVEIASAGRRELQPVESYDGPLRAIARLAAALTTGEDDAARSTWDRATVAMELVDAVQLSLQKGRSIEIHPQQLTEQLAFRGTMAALGCGMLALAMLAMLMAGVLGDVLKLRPARVWPLVLLAVLALFLLLQVVPLLVAKRRKPRPDAVDGDADSS
jgi:hypothetical protein